MAKDNPNHQRFFESFFSQDKNLGYAEIKVNNAWYLIRHWDGNKQKFTIDVYSEESYNNYVRGKQTWKEQQSQMNHLKSI